jgi:iron complex outermembrane receptor protein
MKSSKAMRLSAVLKFTSALIVASGAMGSYAYAQTTDTTTATNSDQIESVVVTANRRFENAQRVPIAISAVTAEDAAKLGVTDGQSLMDQVPGLNFNRQANASIPFLRGVGSPVGQPGDEPSVAFYVDDVYMPAGAASIANFNSIDSIEVEKGPQGTLFGRNATGGVIQVFTKNPTDDPELDASIGFANYDTYSGSIYATGQIADNLDANVAVYGSRQNGGWGKDRCAQLYGFLGCTTKGSTFTGSDFGGRAKFLWTPTSRTTVLLAVDYDKTVSQEGLGFHAYPGTTSTGFPPALGFYDTVEDEPSHFGSRQDGISLKVTQDLGWANLVSISAYRDLRAISNLDEDAGPLDLLDTHLYTLEHTFTQEVRLVSPDDPKFNWIVGAFYYDDTVSAPYHFYGALIPTFTGTDFSAVGTGDQWTKSYSGFGQATYAIFPDTHLTAGLRYTVDQRRFAAFVTTPSLGTTEASNSPMSKNFPKLTGRLSLDHEFTDDIMGYIAFNRGFKSGVYNTTVFPVPGAPTQGPVSPEVLDSYTAGFKSEFFDHTLRANVEAFYYKYSNIQIDEVIGASTVLSNAASATMKGVDADITWLPIENLTLTASGEYLNGRYGNFPDGIYFVYNGGGNCTFSPFNASGCPTGPAGATPPHYNPVTGQWNLKGLHTIQSPPFSLTLTGDYTIPTTVGPFDVNLSYFHGGDYYSDADNGLGQIAPSKPDNDRQKLLNIFNGSVGWNAADGKWDVRVWGKNLTGVKYWSFNIEDAFATQYSPAPPRTYGITLTTHL